MSTDDSRLVLVIDTGRSNAASLMAALERAGAQTRLTTSAAEVVAAPYAVLPGVGAFGPVMDRLRAAGLDQALRARFEANKPTMGVCLGMQLFFESSEESPGAVGIGAVKGAVTTYKGGLRVPEFGWNRVRTPEDGSVLAVPDGWAYYANSYKVDEAPVGWKVAVSDYGAPFVAAMEKGPLLLCQFHPELSGTWGLELLRRWLGAKGDGITVASSRIDKAARATRASLGRILPPRVIPCLDVKDGRVVKGVRFQALRDSGDPAELAARYEADGADEIVILDITAGIESQRTRVEVVRAVRKAVGVPLCVGGGVRCLEDAERILTAGADKVSVNSMGFRKPELLTAIAREFGRQACVSATDVARRGGTPFVVLDAGQTETDTPAVDWIRRAVASGAGEILLTSRDRDGTRAGYDLSLLSEASSAVPDTPVIASGGAATPEQLLAGIEAGADAALLAGALHDGSLSIREIKDYLRHAGMEAR